MGRHTGEYLLGTTLLAVAMLLALLQDKSESAHRQHGGMSSADHPPHGETASNLRQRPSIAGISQQPACAVLENLALGTRIVVGSLDVSGGRHAILVTVRSDDSMPVASLPVVRCSINDAHRLRNARCLHNAMCISAKAQQVLCARMACDQRLNESPARVFLTPHFNDTGTIHEPSICQFIGESSHVRVYIDQRHPQARDAGQVTAWSESLTSAAEFRALPIVDAWIGAITDVDRDQKLSIVITDLDQRRRHATGSAPIHGCIREADYRSDSDFCGDIIYVDPGVFELPTAELAALLTHEMTHAAVCSMPTAASTGFADTTESGGQPAGLPVPSWLNEAVAHFVELHCSDPGVHAAGVSENFQRRIDDFFKNPAGSPIVAAEDVLSLEERRRGSRGAATLFLAPWFSSSEALQQFVRSKAALDCRIEHLAQEPYADVFRDWTLSLATMPTSPLPTSCKNPTLHIDLLPAAGNHERFSLLGTAFLCFECSEDIASLVIESNEAARLQISIIEPEARITRMATAVTRN